MVSPDATCDGRPATVGRCEELVSENLLLSSEGGPPLLAVRGLAPQANGNPGDCGKLRYIVALVKLPICCSDSQVTGRLSQREPEPRQKLSGQFSADRSVPQRGERLLADRGLTARDVLRG